MITPAQTISPLFCFWDLSGKNAVDSALCATIVDALWEAERGFDPRQKDEAARVYPICFFYLTSVLN